MRRPRDRSRAAARRALLEQLQRGTTGEVLAAAADPSALPGQLGLPGLVAGDAVVPLVDELAASAVPTRRRRSRR